MGDTAEEMLAGLMAAARTSVPDRVAGLLAERGQSLGASNVTLYLVDQEQYQLVPLPRSAAAGDEPLGIDSTLAGRCFRQTVLLEAENGRRVWLPLLDGLERLGVIQLDFPTAAARAAEEHLQAFAALGAD